MSPSSAVRARARRARRPLCGVLALGTAALLSGCGVGSSPIVTVFTPGHGSVTVEAQCWKPEGKLTDAADCPVDAHLTGALEVEPGATIGISVDKDIAEKGWVPTVNGQQVAPQVDDSYYRFALSETDFQKGALTLGVYASGDTASVVRGLWTVTLTRA